MFKHRPTAFQKEQQNNIPFSLLWSLREPVLKTKSKCFWLHFITKSLFSGVNKGVWREVSAISGSTCFLWGFSARPDHTATNNHPTRTCLLWRSRSWRHPPTRQLSRCSEWAFRSRTARCPEGTKAGELCPWRPRNGFLKIHRDKVRKLWDQDFIMNSKKKKKSYQTEPSHFIKSSVCGLFCLLFVFFLQWIYLYLFIRFQRWDVSPGLLCDCATSWSLLYYPTNINIKITSTPQRLVIRGHIEGIVAFNSVWLRVPRAPRGEPLRFGISGSTLSKKQTLMRVKSSPARINKARGHRISLRGRCHVNLPDGRTAAPDLHPFCYRNLAVTRSLRYDGRLVCDLDANTHTLTPIER